MYSLTYGALGEPWSHLGKTLCLEGALFNSLTAAHYWTAFTHTVRT